MSWRERMLGFDTETDGPLPEQARIISACAGWATPDGWNPRNWLLKPERPIPAEATAVHGISTEHAKEHGVPRPEALAEIRDALLAAWELDAVVVGHNIIYDLTATDRELRRVGLAGLDVIGPVFDTLVADKALDRYRRGSRKLIDVAQHHGIVLDAADAHGADADALTACRIAWKLAPHAPSDLAELTAWQQEQFADQRRSFAEYRRRKGEPLDDESTDWPIRPWVAQEAAVA